MSHILYRPTVDSSRNDESALQIDVVSISSAPHRLAAHRMIRVH